MRAAFPDGWIAIFCPRRNAPPVKVPVTTVPIPCRLKTRSTGRRGFPMSRGGGVLVNSRASANFSSFKPRPLSMDVGTIGRIGKGCVAQIFADGSDPARFVLRQINFCQRDHGARDAEIRENLQVLFGLRHPAVVGRDEQAAPNRSSRHPRPCSSQNLRGPARPRFPAEMR